MIALFRLRAAVAALAIAATLVTAGVSHAASLDASSLSAKPKTGTATGPTQPDQPALSPNVIKLKFADLDVEFLSVSTNGNTSNFLYRIENQGSAAAKQSKVEKVCVYQSGPSASSIHTATSWQQLGDVAPGASIDVTISCTPSGNDHTVASSMRAYTESTELVTNNNSDSTNNLGGN